ncbi:MAG TPA: N-acetyl-gamma-glutamyl-phosphate reductase [Terriglobia bacterium]|nr:N-acetyl-gamma-glutamyl-phosphate reductase [Terriglobia bacterium]
MKETNSILDRELPQENQAPVRREGLVRVAIAGATGYAGRELITLLARHPFARIARLMSSGRTEKQPFPIEQSHPALRKLSQLSCHPLRVEDISKEEVDLVFLATPHEVSHDLAPEMVERGLRVVDLSGAFRLKNFRAYPRWYGFEHHAVPLLKEAVYGITELNAETIAPARLVSNPGCYATSVILALAPLVQAGWLDKNSEVISDSKSGASGAGRVPSDKLHFTEVDENCRAYNLFNHRHVPEMVQALGLDEAKFTFTPHLLPIIRGILSTVYVRLAPSIRPKSAAKIVSVYRNFYTRAPLVRVYDEGVLPEIQAVAHTNYTDLGFSLDAATGRLIVISALDNLGKGAAGQAIQNMNVMFGFPQETGLA